MFGGWLAGTESRRSGIGRLHQRLFVQRLQHGLALGTGAVHRGTTDHLGRLAHRGSRGFLHGLGERLFVLVLVVFIDGRGGHRASGRLAHGRWQLVILIFVIEGGDGSTAADFRLARLIVVQLGLGTTPATDHTHLADAIAVERIVVTFP
ncbi:hypothetical protein D3C80_1504600 [compost metagenome]